jgi:hypothetical protein
MSRERYPAFVEQDDPTGPAWIDQVNRRGADDVRGRESLGRLVKAEDDPAETAYYEAMSDPSVLALEKAQRSHAGQYLRRLRRRRADQLHRD